MIENLRATCARPAQQVRVARQTSGVRKASPIKPVGNGQLGRPNSAVVPISAPNADLAPIAARVLALRHLPDLGREAQAAKGRPIEEELVVIKASQTEESGADVPDTLSSSLSL
jgi:hypothetical protein